MPVETHWFVSCRGTIKLIHEVLYDVYYRQFDLCRNCTMFITQPQIDQLKLQLLRLEERVFDVYGIDEFTPCQCSKMYCPESAAIHVRCVLLTGMELVRVNSNKENLRVSNEEALNLFQSYFNLSNLMKSYREGHHIQSDTCTHGRKRVKRKRVASEEREV